MNFRPSTTRVLTIILNTRSYLFNIFINDLYGIDKDINGVSYANEFQIWTDRDCVFGWDWDITLIGQLTEFSQFYNNSHNSKYPIEKLHLNTQTNQEKGI